MSGGITIGMVFGSYDGMVQDLGNSYDKTAKENAAENGNESEYLFRFKNSKKVAANGYRENIKYLQNGAPMFANAVIFHGGYQYGTSAKTPEDLKLFDYIQGTSQYAIDLNGNGKVDEDEIFDGNLDRFAYKQAKDSGNLSNYRQLLNQYIPNK